MLPSQTARPSASRAHMYRRGKGLPLLTLGGGALALIVIIFAVKWMMGGGDPANADAGVNPAPSNAASESAPNPPPAATDKRADSNTSKPASKPDPVVNKPNEPVKIAMGGSVPSSALAGASKPNSTPPAPPMPSPQSPAAKPATSAIGAGSPSSNSPTRANQTPQQPTHSPVNAPSSASNTPVSQRVQTGLDLIKQNRPVDARKMLSEALNASGVTPTEAERIRDELTKVNERLVFSPEVAANDPYASWHQISSGETLAKIAKKLNVAVDWRFIQTINQISDPSKIRVGQRIKIVQGPFHVIIDKRTFRADLYMGDGSDRVYVRSLSVGLGEFGATPEGVFVVKPDSKLINPAWTNPRTGESFQAADPKNPLGEYWIGLIGASDNIRGLETYGIHGTIDPASIGKELSMGCVRLRDEDIKLLYEVLTEQGSRIEIHGSDWP